MNPNTALNRMVLNDSKIIFLGIIVLFFSPSLMAERYQTGADAIERRIAPFGQVNVADVVETAVNAVVSSEPVVQDETELGEQVYLQHCAVCHDAGIAGAPKFRDSLGWNDRIAQGMEVMLSHVINGYNAMPMKGTCMTCDDEQLEDAINYMLPQ